MTRSWKFSILALLAAGLLVVAPELHGAQKGHAGRVTLLQDHEYFDALVSGIRSARDEITGCFFLFKLSSGRSNLPQRVAEELVAARRRGVAVTIGLEQDTGGRGEVYGQNRRVATLLAEGGVRVRFDAPKTTTHVKALVIDGRYVYLGSHNLTQSALKHNNELSVMIDSPELAKEVTVYLNGL